MEKKMIALIAIVVLGTVLISGCIGGDNTTTGNSGADDNENTTSGSNYKGYQVKITYGGSWSGSAGSSDSITSYDGTGSETIDLGEVSNGIASATIQKTDSGSDELKVEILKDGKVVKEGSTTAEYGVVTIVSG